MTGLLETLISNTVVIVPIAVLARLCSRWGARPAWVHSLWLLILLKLVTPPIFRVPVTITWENPTRLVSELPAAGRDLIHPSAELQEWQLAPVLPAPSAETLGTAIVVAAEPAAPPWRPPLMLWASWLWLLGAGAVALISLRQLWSFSRRAADLSPAPEPLLREVRELANKVRLRRTPEVCLTRDVISPMVWAPAFRPRLILPETLLERLSADERQTLILHELAHVRRRDHWVRYLELAVRVLHWCNPLAWWAIHELRAAEEECCDVWVTSVFRNSERQYSAALLAAAEFLSSPTRRLPATTPGVGGIPELRRRLQMIFRPHTHRSLNLAGRLSIVFAALLMIPLLPGWSQDAPPERDPFEKAQPADVNGDGLIDVYLANSQEPRADDPPSPAGVARAIDLAVQLLVESGHHAEARIIVEATRRAAAAPDAPRASRGRGGLFGGSAPRAADRPNPVRGSAPRPAARGESYPEPERRPSSYDRLNRFTESQAPAAGERLNALEQQVRDLTEMLQRVLLRLESKDPRGSGDR